MKGSRAAMLRYLSRIHGFGAQVSCNWGGWWGAPLNPYEIHDTPGMEGMQAWLAGDVHPPKRRRDIAVLYWGLHASVPEDDDPDDDPDDEGVRTDEPGRSPRDGHRTSWS